MDEVANLVARPFLLMEGGPLFNVQKRVGLIKHNAPFMKRRALLAALLTWLPLLVLSAIQGRAFGHSVPVPFIRDFSTYTRFLLAVPLLLLAENILGPRIAEAAAHFVTSGVVVQKDFERFDKIVELGLRARDSILAEVVIAILAYVFSFLAFRETAVHVTTWYATFTGDGESLTWAGLWLIFFCIPLYQFLMLRWLWRLFLWFQFLSRARKLDIQLFPTHPDGAGGLGFVGEAQRFFGILLFAFSLGSAGVIANEVLYAGIPLKNFAPSIIAYVIVSLVIVLGPLIVFTGTLLETKRKGLHQYGTLATTYTGSFQKKWIEHHSPETEPLLGTADIQSLADLGNSYSFVEKMKPLPLEFRTVIHLVLAGLLPLTPLLLTVMSPKDILKLLLKVVM
ncbi:MAG TPA: hypothetical protein VKH40_10505 [Alloacidobacterium sp.]|nr:hypothetical protein [Alloacidobacterium sp.]